MSVKLQLAAAVGAEEPCSTLRRVASYEFSPAFQRRERLTTRPRRAARLKAGLVSVVATRRELVTILIPGVETPG